MSAVAVAAVGKLKQSYWIDAEAEYRKRLTRFCKYQVQECKTAKTQELVLADHYIIALDERGKQLTSTAFAAQLGVLLDAGHKIGFFIGGAEGLTQPARARANQQIAFGSMTMPHQLVRVVLAEQVYRAFTILARHPYHKQ